MDIKCTGEEQPEFQQILSRFSNELSKLDENSKEILNKTYRIQNLSQPRKGDTESIELANSSIIDQLHSSLNKLNELNDVLFEARRALTKFVG